MVGCRLSCGIVDEIWSIYLDACRIILLYMNWRVSYVCHPSNERNGKDMLHQVGRKDFVEREDRAQSKLLKDTISERITNVEVCCSTRV
jgi:hypothetical protein